MLVVEELYQEAVINTSRKLVIFNGELDRIRSGCILRLHYWMIVCSSTSHLSIGPWLLVDSMWNSYRCGIASNWVFDEKINKLHCLFYSSIINCVSILLREVAPPNKCKITRHSFIQSWLHSLNHFSRRWRLCIIFTTSKDEMEVCSSGSVSLSSPWIDFRERVFGQC